MGQMVAFGGVLLQHNTCIDSFQNLYGFNATSFLDLIFTNRRVLIAKDMVKQTKNTMKALIKLKNRKNYMLIDTKLKDRLR